jgi:hypothetical protein
VLAEAAGEPEALAPPEVGAAVGAGFGVAGPGVAGRGVLVGPVVGATQLGAAVGLKISLHS